MPEVLSDFLLVTKAGLYCRYGDFYLDPQAPVHHAVISHAHGDHAGPGHMQVYATAPTLAFMEQRFGKRAYRNGHPQQYRATFEVGGVQVTFIPAGHILGSAQVLMLYRGIRYVYTGDYKLQPDPTCAPFEYVKADVLITESTFANPSMQHPDPAEEIQKLNAVDTNILLGAYSLGKAQRLTYLINQYCPEKVIWVHHAITAFHKLYQQYGNVPLNYRPYHRKALKENTSKQIYLVPPSTFRYYFRASNVVRVFASGWHNLHAHNEISLYISDHVDWQDILQTIQSTGAREVWTLHGDGCMLENHFKNSPIRVKRLM